MKHFNLNTHFEATWKHFALQFNLPRMIPTITKVFKLALLTHSRETLTMLGFMSGPRGTMVKSDTFPGYPSRVVPSVGSYRAHH